MKNSNILKCFGFESLVGGSSLVSITLIIMGVVILVVGQLFNLVIAVFEPGIQGARHLYVEFFSKFYFGNGKQFSPFGSHRRYTLKKFDKK